MRSSRPLRGLLLAATLVVGACSFGSEATFTQGAALDACDGALPVCNTTAGCRLIEEDSYIEGSFPGLRQIIVPTEGEAVIRLRILWRTMHSPGADTEILWYEPACVEVFRYESQGVNIFDEVGRDGVWVKEHRVFRAGDHLVEVRSDATGEYLLRPEVLTPDEYEQEKATLF